MTDKFTITPVEQLLEIILNQYKKDKKIVGIPEELFFQPNASDPFRFQRFGQLLENPVGVAAGPHTQLSQNIVAAWLCGARYIELKTVQTLDELEVSKPCIDMQDEGYNCEWSQELKIKQSFEQYLDAWIIIHILKHHFGWNTNGEPGVIFNMSVGYNLEGILNENVQWFFAKMKDASVELEQKISKLKKVYPDIDKISISSCLSDNITLSTMHGCPPDEIEKIGVYLLKDKGLHTTIKLNPTLLGKEILLAILANSGFETEVPDIAFEHDLKYEDAIRIIKNLEELANEKRLHFGLKLTNTLESKNNKDVFERSQEMMYMSGKALHPISISLAEKLQNEFNGSLDISFSGGVDAFNISNVIASGLYPATVCSDILKPGGYGRLAQYFEELRKDFAEVKAESISQFIINKANKGSDERESALENLKKYSEPVLEAEDFKRKGIKPPSIKSSKKLGAFDCIHAPCETTCPTNQAIPEYMYYASKGDFAKAKEVILDTNPFPNTTGMVCDHTCQSKCTRINYDSSLLIREVKRSVSELGNEHSIRNEKVNGKKVAIIGAGPSGLSCAYFLAKAGFEVTVYEAKPKAGGMVSAAIPKFRLTNEAVEYDINQILELGVKIYYNKSIDKAEFDELRKENDFVYIAAGAQNARAFYVEGMEAKGVLNPLQFLYDVKNEKPTGLGKRVLIIGGGNTAMDAARTAKRLVGADGQVRILYRRTIKQMPANYEEIKAVLDESIEIQELVNPLSVSMIGGKLTGLVCQKMRLGEKDNSGRARPEPIDDAEFEIPCDTIVPAVGQDLAFDFINTKKLDANNYETELPEVFIGGDALNGGLSAIAAIGDGRKVAQLIIDRCGIEFETKKSFKKESTNYRELMIKKTKRIKPVEVSETSLNRRNNFDLIVSALTKEETIEEASRCLLCNEICNICTTLCPNLALFGYRHQPFKAQLSGTETKFVLTQAPQILHIADWCNQCGNCNTFCPTSGAPYKEKPHFHLTKESFNNDSEGYLLTGSASETTLLYKNDEEMCSLTENSEYFTYFSDKVRFQLNKQTLDIEDDKSFNDKIEKDWKKAVEMCVILQGAKQLLRHQV
jgi:putative selenate reductase